MPEIVVLLAALAVAGFAVVLPMWRGLCEVRGDDGDAAALRHRVALEALRDVEADRRAGSLDDAGYADQLAEAEARASETRAALADPAPRSSAKATGVASSRPSPPGRSRRSCWPPGSFPARVSRTPRSSTKASPMCR